jgi:hypothetical protein
MENMGDYERYPAWIVVVCNLVALAIYAIGATILSALTPWLSVPYLLYCLWLEIRVLQKSCVNCAYYGRACGFGKGKLCALLFRRGDPHRFAARQITWVDVLPDFLVSIVPIAGGIILLVRRFDWLILIWMIALLLLSFGGSAVVRGSLVCKHCQQRAIGCPAEKLFGQKKTTEEPADDH